MFFDAAQFRQRLPQRKKPAGRMYEATQRAPRMALTALRLGEVGGREGFGGSGAMLTF